MPDDVFVSYAQNSEDVVLARALRPDDRAGFWVDVGAGDPVDMSVTAAFAERGWRGINIEPLELQFEQLSQARPRDTNLRLALGATPGLGKLFVGRSEYWGASTMVPEVADSYRSAGQEFEAIEIVVSTLAEVAAQHVHGPVDFLKIDVEGCEREVIAGADWATFRPRIVVVESVAPNTAIPTHEQWEPLLLEAGYALALFDGLNRFYARADEPDLIARLAVPANPSDEFVPFNVIQLHGEIVRVGLAARLAKDEAAIAQEQIAILREELDAAQLRTAQISDRIRSTRSLQLALALRSNYQKLRRAAGSASRTLKSMRDDDR